MKGVFENKNTTRWGYPDTYYTGFNDTLHSFRAILLKAVAVAPRFSYLVGGRVTSWRIGDVRYIDLSLRRLLTPFCSHVPVRWTALTNVT